MEYRERAGSAAYAVPDERAGFIRRTYAHLAFAVLGFLALEYALLSLPGVREFAALMTQGWNWLLVLGAFFVVSLVADRMARSEVSRGVQYAGLALYVAIQAVIFLPLMVVATFYSDPTVLPSAALITGLLFLGLTVVAFTTRAAVPVPDSGLPRELVDAAREAIENNSQPSRSGQKAWELPGRLLRCAECGYGMQSKITRGSGKQKRVLFYYRCGGRYNSKNGFAT